MKDAVEMGSDAMIYVPSFIKTGSAIQKLIGGHTDTQTAWRSYEPTLGRSKSEALCDISQQTYF
jgi:hypothetical protein